LRSGEIIAGLVSSTTSIPLAMAFGMFAFVPLGDEYFAYGAMAGLLSAVISAVISVVFGDRSTRVYAPRITTTFFLGLLLFSLLHRDPSGRAPDVSATLLVFFAALALAIIASFDALLIKLLQALGRELSVRIRHANMTIQRLET
jgi:sulfate permease, SulP family